MPTIFVSSTVLDFCDLRSALKYELEKFGYSVQMSEYSDFEKPVEQNSYDACFDAIRAADAFVLLVGGRRGGWYDEEKNVSITQAEYRVAYEQAQLRQMPIITCIRQQTWDLIGYVKAVDRACPNILETSTQFIQDPKHLRAFLDEIRRVEEMRVATRLGAKLPRSNWVHVFSTFSDLMDIVRTGLRIGRGVAGELLLTQVSDELLTFGRQFLVKANGRTEALFHWLPDLISSFNLTIKQFNSSSSARVKVTNAQMSQLKALRMMSNISLHSPFAALRAAILSPMLADFDTKTRSLSESPLQNALRRTLSAIDEAEEFARHREKSGSTLFAVVLDARVGGGRTLSQTTVADTLSAALAAARVLAEAENVIGHLIHNAPLRDAPDDHLADSPFTDLDTILTKEADVSAIEMSTWIKSRVYSTRSHSKKRVARTRPPKHAKTSKRANRRARPSAN